MSTHDLFARLSAALGKAGIAYMFTGSFASSFHGTPRASNDFDLVMAPTAEQLKTLKGILIDADYYFDLEEALHELKRGGQFNIIDLASGWKIDFIIRKKRAFSLSEFNRRFPIEFEGLSIFMASAEDVVLAKLEWAKKSSSERQIEDVAGILRIRANELDRTYIERWIEDLQVEPQWRQALKVAGLSG
jgi:hypothetical protein